MRYLNRNYGIVGDVSSKTYKDGSPLQVGDVVDFQFQGQSHKNAFVIHNGHEYGVMGIASMDFKLGKGNNSNVTLVKKCYNVKVGHTDKYGVILEQSNDTKTIIIDGESIEISAESFKALKDQLTKECC